MFDIGDLRARARDLLQSGQVASVLGYRRGSAGAGAEPAVLTDAAAADTLVWDPTCVHNLALQLVNERKHRKETRSTETRPIAVVAKGCDSRAVTVLLQENYFRREDVVVLGVSCEGSGVVDPRKLARALKGRPAQSVTFAANGDVLATTAAGEQTIAAAEVLADRCLECRAAYPTLADVTFGDKVTERSYNAPFTALAAVAELPEQERWGYWAHQFERCLRCYACRSVCPMCFCDECVVDSISFIIAPDTSAEDKANRIKWIERSTDSSENAMYHMTRAMHLAGRCIDCAECERVCPVNIPVRLLNNILEKEAREMFDYEPGMDPTQASLVSSFRDDDPNSFIR
jgi:ferredoxin